MYFGGYYASFSLCDCYQEDSQTGGKLLVWQKNYNSISVTFVQTLPKGIFLA